MLGKKLSSYTVSQLRPHEAQTNSNDVVIKGQSSRKFLAPVVSEAIAPEMVVVDDHHNGWRHLLLPIARTDHLVLDAVLAASAFHFSERGAWDSALPDPHELYFRVIRRLQRRQDLLAYDTHAKQAVVLSIMVLLLVVMINGCSDFPIIFHMLQSALDAIGGEGGIADGGELGDFSLRQIHK